MTDLPFSCGRSARSVPRPPEPAADWLARVTALAGVASAALHLLVAYEHNGGAFPLVMLGMAATCLFCAVHIGLGEAGARAWLLMAALAAGMLVAHLLLIGQMRAMPMHHGGDSAALLAAPVLNLGLVGAAVFRRLRHGRWTA